jgi:REP element-mobilizing transposase RayT
MSYNPHIHHRSSIRLKGYDYSQAGLYFVTICVPNKQCLFGEIVNGEMILNESGKIVSYYWLEIPQHFPDAILHEFVIMPNHIHGIIEITNVGAKNFSPLQTTNVQTPQRPNGTSRTIGSIVRGFKIGVTKHLGYSVWQRNYHEHIILNEQSYQKISDYILNNPEKWMEDRFYWNEK